LIDAAGTLWLIDFGAVGLIDPVTMESLQLMGAGLATGQPALLARALRTISGADGESIQPQALEAELSLVLSEQPAEQPRVIPVPGEVVLRESTTPRPTGV